MILKFLKKVAKGLKLKVRKFWRLIPKFTEVAGIKLVGEFFGIGLRNYQHIFLIRSKEQRKNYFSADLKLF